MDCASRYAFFSSSDIPDKSPEVNTNVIEINLNCLRNESSIATGDPLLCKNCECLLNSSSVLIRSDAGVLWECEFCNHKNNILIENEEIPQQLEVTYFLEQELEAENQREISQIDTNDNTAIVFCIDILARCGRRRAVQLAEEGKLEEAKNDAIEWNKLMKTEIKGPESLAKQMVFENDVKEITKNIDHQLIKEKTEGVEFHGLPQADSKKRRQNYGDTFVVGMSMMKKKK